MNPDSESTRPWSGSLSECNGWYVASYDSAVRDPSEVVVYALATLADTDPHALRPLHNSIDPDALDALFAPTIDGRPRTGGEVSFVHDGYGVAIDLDGEIRVRDVTDATGASATGAAESD